MKFEQCHMKCVIWPCGKLLLFSLKEKEKYSLVVVIPTFHKGELKLEGV